MPKRSGRTHAGACVIAAWGGGPLRWSGGGTLAADAETVNERVDRRRHPGRHCRTLPVTRYVPGGRMVAVDREGVVDGGVRHEGVELLVEVQQHLAVAAHDAERQVRLDQRVAAVGERER